MYNNFSLPYILFIFSHILPTQVLEMHLNVQHITNERNTLKGIGKSTEFSTIKSSNISRCIKLIRLVFSFPERSPVEETGPQHTPFQILFHLNNL